MNTNPETEYGIRLKQRQAAAARHESLHRRIGNTRLILFLAAAVMAWFAFKTGGLHPLWLSLPATAFLALVVRHSRVLKNLNRSRRAIQFYETGLARIEERWEGCGEPGKHFNNTAHLYAQDLDLFGNGSLFQLLCSARTHAGEEKLASWLKTPADLEEVRSRQEAVDDLRNRLDLREDLAVLGEDIRAGLDPPPLLAWGKGPAMPPLIPIRIVAALLSLFAMASLTVWGLTGQHTWFLGTVLAEVVFFYLLRRKIRPAARKAELACRDLKLLSLVLARLEKETFKSRHLGMLKRALDRNDRSPSRLIAHLNSLTELLESRRNAFFAPIAFLLIWEIQFVFLIEDWRRKYGSAIAGWLEATAEFEALSSLAGYAYEHPEDPFPELTEQSPCFDGRGLGHPLIPEGRCIRNDVILSKDSRVLIVSGSNMSGKSTLLRTVGINTVLALTGAPVRAHHLRISSMVPGASIRITDSLQAGTSRFYAEITRLQKLVALAGGPVPLLFLLDELLHGTNSHDRRIGAEAIVEALVRRNAVGLLTTHDLSLAHIADRLAPLAANVHFEDHIENGRMEFDYKLRRGVVRKSNALELMRSIGLEV
ncbi:MAG: DNA mismatch repair protein MutS [Acidobacteria bacterium]|nr:DNA mismatch repair protein MutS [Acidobacteriota bacterium]